jgi:hypothetical protein
MQTIKFILLSVTIIVSLSGCIERFYPNSAITSSSKIVIEGAIVDNCEPQHVRISRSTSLENASFMGISDCTVKVTDNDGNTFTFLEELYNKGYYTAVIPEQYLTIGKKYWLEVITIEGKIYRSSAEEMLPSPPVDSIYYNIEHHETTEVGEMVDGVQFFVDFKGSDFFSNYYRWVLEETYEYHSSWPIEEYLNEYDSLITGPLDYSTYTCYKTDTIDGIYILSTDGLNSNQYQKAKLHFVDDHSQRLMYNYSFILKQQSLSRPAYLYWKNLLENTQSEIGITSKQPAMPKGNFININDSTESVLGYFSVSSETTKRIVIKGFREFKFLDVGLCAASSLDNKEIPRSPRPLYFTKVKYKNGTMGRAYAKTECFDCTLLGGTVEKPSFFE